MSNRDHCFSPVVYQYELSCGHTQLATRLLPVGASYPCWVACDPAKPTAAQVVAVSVWENTGTPVVVMSGASDADMRAASLVAAVANGDITADMYEQLR